MQLSDSFLYIVPVDDAEHPFEKPFCWDQTCDCHEDDVAIAIVAQQVQDGLFTPQEATDFVKGRGI